jgi:hypothetical protein
MRDEGAVLAPDHRRSATHPGGTPAPRRDNPMAQASFTLGIIGVVGLVVPPGLLLAPISGVLAIIFGVLGQSQARRGAPGGERAVTGIALGAVAVIVSAVLLFLFRHLLVRVVHEIDLGS